MRKHPLYLSAFVFLCTFSGAFGAGLDPIPGTNGLPTRLAKDGKQWLSAPVTLTLKNETTDTTVVLKEDGTCSEFGITLKSDWKTENDWLVWRLDFQGTETPTGYTMIFEFPVLKEADRIFTPSEKGVVDLSLMPASPPMHYGDTVYGKKESYVLPLASPFDSKRDTALTIAFAPDENIPNLVIDWKDASVLRFTLGHRGIGKDHVSTLKFHFTMHPADERCVIDAYAKRYPEWFEPVMPSGVFDGAFWYHHILRCPEFQELKRQNVRYLWSTFWFTHLGEYLPDTTEWAPWTYSKKNYISFPEEKMSDDRINRFCNEMNKEDIRVFAYFNVTEYGGKGEDGNADRAEQILRERFADALIKRADGSTIGTWEGAMAMNANEKYSLWQCLKEQIERHLLRLPGIEGFLIDRLDWAATLDFAHDDGLTMVGEKPAENLALIVAGAVDRVCGLAHTKNKRVYVNQFDRIEPLKHTDGYCHEWDIMSMGYLSPFKPAAAWFAQTPYTGPDYSPHEANLKKRLQIALFPQLIAHEFPVCQQPPHPVAADCNEIFTPLFAPFVGKRQVLLPHPISVTGANDCNLFTDINGNWLVPVTSHIRFLTKGDRSTETATVTLDVPDANEATWAHAIPVAAPPYKALLKIERGKAVVTLSTHGAATMLLIGKGKEPALPETDHQRLLDVCNARFPEKPRGVTKPPIASPDFSKREVRSAILAIAGQHYFHAAPLQFLLNGEIVGTLTTDSGTISCGNITPNEKPIVTVTASDQGAWWFPTEIRLNVSMDDQMVYSAFWIPETSSLQGTGNTLTIELQWSDQPLPELIETDSKQ